MIVGHYLRGPALGALPVFQVATTNPSTACDPRDHRCNPGAPTPAPTPAPLLAPCGTKDSKGNPIQPCDPTVPAGFGPTVTVGPFQFAAGSGNLQQGNGYTVDDRNSWTSPSQLTAAQYQWLQQQISQHIGNADDQNVVNGVPAGDKWATLQYWFPQGNGSWWHLGDSVDSDYKSPDGRAMPVNALVANVTNPSYPGVPYGVFLFIGGNGSGHVPFLTLKFAPMALASHTAWSTVFGPLCSLLTSAGGQAASAAALKAAAAAPAAAAAVGMTVIGAKALCPAAAGSTSTSSKLPTVAAPTPKWVWWGLAAAAVGGGAWLLLR